MTQPDSTDDVTRKPVHTRTITCTSYERTDGLWDVEGELQDRKHYEATLLEGGPIPPGTIYQSMRVTFTVDDGLKIVEAQGGVLVKPFPECAAASLPLQKLVGVNLGRGWRKAVAEALETDRSCTHMREMLFMMPSAAIQAIPGYIKVRAGLQWPPPAAALTTPLHFIGGCVSWRHDGAVVLRHYPQFHKPSSGE